MAWTTNTRAMCGSRPSIPIGSRQSGCRSTRSFTLDPTGYEREERIRPFGSGRGGEFAPRKPRAVGGNPRISDRLALPVAGQLHARAVGLLYGPTLDAARRVDRLPRH